MDYQFESFFPTNDPDLAYYQSHVKAFESDNDFLIIGLSDQKSFFNLKFLKKVSELTDSLEQLKHVVDVISPTSMTFPVIGPLGISKVPVLHINKPNLLVKDSIRIFSSERLLGNVLSNNGKNLSLLLKTEEMMPKKQADSLVISVEQLVESYNFSEGHVAGKIKGQYYFIDRLLYELVLFISISIIILAIFLYISFRASWGVWVPIAVIGISVLWLLSFMAWIDKPIDIMTTLLPTILFVVGISNVVHILERYIEELRFGQEKILALITSFKEVGLATFLTSITTAIGFLTLMSSSITPVKEFGIFTALGVFISFILAFTLLPSILVNAGTPGVISGKKKEIKIWSIMLHRFFKWTINRKIRFLFLGAGVIIISLIGMRNLEINNFFLEDFSINEKVTNDYRYFENEFSGFRPLEIAVFTKDTSSKLTDFEAIQELQELDSLVKIVYKTNFIISPLTYSKTINSALNGGKENYFKTPKTERENKKVNAKLKRVSAKTIGNYLNNKQNRGRFSIKIKDYGGKKMKALNARFDSIMINEVKPKHIDYRFTGMALLVDKNNQYLAKNITTGLAIAFVAIAIIMGLLFRSLSMIIISLIPNILPLIMIGGFMGFTGIDLKISTSIIFTIAFGIAVDDTIHFMSKFKMELNKGKSMLYALKRTYISTGKAIIVTTLILCSGFVLLISSSVASTYYIGLLISLTLFFAVFSDLVFLPVLIILFYKHNK